ncbi:MAG: hypothetical protein JWM81_503 [Candidatus Saccharibacteria bacterium]|nr:hypothetical protein [Candidatus Saccharibacteria bacterium]
MQLSQDFPELNQGQIKMLERYIQEREQQAIEKFKDSSPR